MHINNFFKICISGKNTITITIQYLWQYGAACSTETFRSSPNKGKINYFFVLLFLLFGCIGNTDTDHCLRKNLRNLNTHWAEVHK
jgi:hypothetical protein